MRFLCTDQVTDALAKINFVSGSHEKYCESPCEEFELQIYMMYVIVVLETGFVIGWYTRTAN
jgi:hypothetical protein